MYYIGRLCLCTDHPKAVSSEVESGFFPGGGGGGGDGVHGPAPSIHPSIHPRIHPGKSRVGFFFGAAAKYDVLGGRRRRRQEKGPSRRSTE